MQYQWVSSASARHTLAVARRRSASCESLPITWRILARSIIDCARAHACRARAVSDDCSQRSQASASHPRLTKTRRRAATRRSASASAMRASAARRPLRPAGPERAGGARIWLSMAPSRAAALGCSRQPATRAPTANPVSGVKRRGRHHCRPFRFAKSFSSNSGPGRLGLSFFFFGRTYGTVASAAASSGHSATRGRSPFCGPKEMADARLCHYCRDGAWSGRSMGGSVAARRLRFWGSGARARGHVVKGHVARSAQPPATSRASRSHFAVTLRAPGIGYPHPAGQLIAAHPLIAASFQMRGVRL